jgi:hypothetical protein
MKKITPRINEKSEEFFKTNFKSVNSGAEYLLESIPAVARIYAGYQLKGKFTADELKLIIDVMNGTMLTAQFAGQHLLPNVQDGIALDHLDEKWEIDADKLKEKIKSLSIPDIFFLEIWIQGFWQQNTESGVELEKYIEELKEEK